MSSGAKIATLSEFNLPTAATLEVLTTLEALATLITVENERANILFHENENVQSLWSMFVSRVCVE